MGFWFIAVHCLCLVCCRSFHWVVIASILKKTNLFLLIFGCGVSILIFWVLRALRWYILLRKMGVQISIVSLYMCTAITVGLATMTPLRSGEILRTEFLKRYGLLERAPGYGSFIIERIIDMVMVAFLATISVFRGICISFSAAAIYTASA
ncbi:MAG: flippase-like domain-containing protein, partial [Armatimonadetes bacterium]|nr:flippase-like domain-containing protein [Armatimonadota bacterium]